ncbi:MAG: stage II sporulation protein D [Firmicutes bacterium]|nr:stage II sporulation protein D [Bacillota bacterium]
MRFSVSRVIGYCMLAVVILPAVLVRGCDWMRPAPRTPPRFAVTVDTGGGQLVNMDLEEYIKGVVAAEMPVNFEPEALKAQAVAARTYAVRRLEQFGGGSDLAGTSFDEPAGLGIDPKREQAWVIAARLRAQWGYLNYYRLWKKISKAVEETRGEVLVHNGQLINAVYHSTSGGPTENSEDVWSEYIPYLRSVNCEWDKDSPRYRETREFSVAEMERLLGVRLNLPAVKAAIAGRSLPGGLLVKARSSTGRVKEILAGGRLFKGTDFRSRLGLRSTRFSWVVAENQIQITTIGNGHGVGLCQYGANGLARLGRDYRAILTYYYTGVQIITLQQYMENR